MYFKQEITMHFILVMYSFCIYPKFSIKKTIQHLCTVLKTHNAMKKTIYITVILLFSLLASAQAQSSSSEYYVKIIVEGVITSQDARVIDSFIRQQNGVIMSRMDHHTKKYFGIYQPSSGITLETYKTWIIDLGYEAKCSINEEYGPGNPKKIKESDCITNPSAIKQN